MTAEHPQDGSLSHAVADHSARIGDRQAVLVNVGAERGPESWVAGRLVRLSQRGCEIVMDEGPEVGRRVVLMVPGFAGRTAHVTLAASERTGFAFDTPLPAAVFDYLVRMSDMAARG